jgi:hypothetical protein
MAASYSISIVEDGENLFAGRTEDWTELLWCAQEALRRRPRATVYLRDAFGRLHQYHADGTTTDLSAPTKRQWARR